MSTLIHKSNKILLCFDDSGSRNPDKSSVSQDGRYDKVDGFALGGILVREEDIGFILGKYRAFINEWGIDYYLHSTKIRCRQGKFAWLQKQENADSFYPALESFLLSLPVIGIACVVHRPGYVARYKEKYNDRLWLMCKTTFSILVERAAKYADKQDRKLEILYESSGKYEDRAIVSYLKELKKNGNPFNPVTSEEYRPLSAEDFSRIILGEPQRKTKSNPLLQIADLFLFPMVKGGYDSLYHPYRRLKAAGKIIDCVLSENDLPYMSVKYSCFDLLA
jgi:hypothetical protein